MIRRVHFKLQARRNRAQRGSSLGLTLVILFAVSMVGVSFYAACVGATLLSNRAAIKTQATALAEAGAQAIFAKITAGIRNGTLTTTSQVGAVTVTCANLDSTPGTDSTTDGSFAASVQSVTGPTTYTATDNTKNPPVVTYTDVYTITVRSTGTGTNGVRSTVQASFDDVQLRNNTDGVYNTYPDGALISNGPIVLQGNAKTKASITLHGAGAMANGVISNVGNSYSVDGPMAVAPASFAATQSALTSINDYGGALSELPGPITNFETPSMVSYEQSKWLTDSTSTGNVIGGAVGTAGTGYNPSTTTLTGPAYINGDLTISEGATLTFNRPAGAVGPVVVYVNGNISFANGNGSIVNNGVTIVTTGTFTAGKNSNYTVGNYPAGSVDSNGNSIAGQPMYSGSGLISLSKSSAAISLGADSTTNVGIVKALKGGVVISGNGTMTGSIIAGGTGSASGIQLSGNPTIIYPGGLNAQDQNDPVPKTIQYYTPYPITRWVQML